MNAIERGLASLLGPPRAQNTILASDLGLSGGSSPIRTDAEAAMRLSTVNRCIEILSDSIAKMPFYVFDSRSRRRITDHPACELLSVRPNPWQTPFVAKKQLEVERINGNGIAWIRRDPRTMQALEYVPIPRGKYSVTLDSSGAVVYTLIHPYTGETIRCGRMDVLHGIAFTRNGYLGISYLERAAEVIRSSRAAQEYASSYYANGGQPSGILKTESDLGGNVEVRDAAGNAETISKKEAVRREWDKRHSGPQNAQRIAVLDMGLDYKPLSISNRDAQFVEQSDLSVQDLARFFGVPLYKLQAGKQSYSSNEQNAIEYVVGTLHPNTTLWEQEFTYKILPPQDVEKGLEIRGNMMAELRGDWKTRGEWYKAMREIGGFSVNDILALEDMPDVEGGEERYASLNYVPLRLWPDLAQKRNGNGGV